MKKSYSGQFFKKYGYYLAMGVCVLSVGVAGWAAVRKMTSPPTDRPLTGTTAVQEAERKADAPVGGVEKETTTYSYSVTEEVKTTAPATSAPAQTTLSEEALNAQAGKPFESYYMAPIGNGLTKPFSGGELVYSATMRDWRVHGGCDFEAEKGGAVKAMTDGIIQNVYEDAMLGTVVEINHGNNVVAKYCGLGKNPPVKKGAAVAMGDRIGIVGEIPCESSEQCHLHFEVTINGKSIDPATLFKIK